MSYQWINDHSRASATLPATAGNALGERRTDKQTAQKIRDALRARSVRAAAQALEHQQVDFATALRVLARPEWRRSCE
jgi:hypothetical protein